MSEIACNQFHSLNIKAMTALNLITREDLEQFKSDLFKELKQLGISNPANSTQPIWLRSVEVRKILHISPATLQNFRINGTLPFTKVGSILFYKYDDLSKVMEQNKSQL